MNSELWSCANDGCRAATWLVRRSNEQPDFWRIAADVDATPFNVAAATPICPHCGTTLEMAQVLEYDARPATRPALVPTLAFSYS